MLRDHDGLRLPGANGKMLLVIPLSRPPERNTRQREAILAAVMAAGRPLLPQEILELAKEQVPAIGIATIYRNLKLLVSDGILQSIELPGDASRYEMAEHARDHHHHFQCLSCRRVFDVEGCPGNLKNMVPRGFMVERHEVTLYGRCQVCAGKPASARRGARVS